VYKPRLPEEGGKKKNIVPCLEFEKATGKSEGGAILPLSTGQTGELALEGSAAKRRKDGLEINNNTELIDTLHSGVGKATS